LICAKSREERERKRSPLLHFTKREEGEKQKGESDQKVLQEGRRGSESRARGHKRTRTVQGGGGLLQFNKRAGWGNRTT